MPVLAGATLVFSSLGFTQSTPPKSFIAKETLITPKVKLGSEKDKELKLGEDETGCKDSALLARIPGCSIIQCDTKENDTVEIQVGASQEGVPQKESMDGAAETLYYLCPNRITPAQIVKLADASLVKAGYKTIYHGKDGDDFPLLTTMKDAQWVQVSTYMYNDFGAYIQTAIQVQAVNHTNIEALLEEMTKTGRVSLFGIRFEKNQSDLPADSDKILADVVALLVRQPEWKIRVDGHSDPLDEKAPSIALSQSRASAVAGWLLEHGIDKSRVSIQGYGATKLMGDSTTEAGREKNRRIELVRF